MLTSREYQKRFYTSVDVKVKRKWYENNMKVMSSDLLHQGSMIMNISMNITVGIRVAFFDSRSAARGRRMHENSKKKLFSSHSQKRFQI